MNMPSTQGPKMNISTVVMTTVLLLGGVSGTVAAGGGSSRSPEITESATLNIGHARAHATVPGQPVAAVYLTISSATPITLIETETNVAKDVQIHNMHVHEGVMQMREVKKPHIAAGETLVLAPGGMHMMLLGLSRQLKAGETVSLILRFEDKNGKRITKAHEVPVQPLGTK